MQLASHILMLCSLLLLVMLLLVTVRPGDMVRYIYMQELASGK